MPYSANCKMEKIMLLGSSSSDSVSSTEESSIQSVDRKDLTEDIWYAIFLLLPFSEIFQLRYVSKVWFSILSNPNFMKTWYKLNISSLPWGLVHYAQPWEDHSPNDNNKLRRLFSIDYPDSCSQFFQNYQTGFSLSFLDPIFPNTSNEEEEEEEEGVGLYIIGSSNGLVLCTTSFFSQKTYFVCNPLTKKWVSLPPPPPAPPTPAGKLAAVTGISSLFGSTTFKVIRIPRFEDGAKEIRVDKFSSDLCEWNIYHVSCPLDVTWDLCMFDKAITHDGVLYWLQKMNNVILVVNVNGNNNHGTRGGECSRLINLPGLAMDAGVLSSHCLGESEGLICYAAVNKKEKSLSVWVLEEDWCLLYKDNTFHEALAEMVVGGVGETLAEMETLQAGGEFTDLFVRRIGLSGSIPVDKNEDYLIKQIDVVGLSPVDKNVVILSYDKYISVYNTRTKGCEQLCFPPFVGRFPSNFIWGFLTFVLKPSPTPLPPLSWGDRSILGVQIKGGLEAGVRTPSVS